jgi:hypothetical protein
LSEQEVEAISDRFIQRLYEKRIFWAPGINPFSIADEVGADRRLTRDRVLPFLEHKNWIKLTTPGCYLTVQGIDGVEDRREGDDLIVKMKSNRIRYLRRLKDIKDETGLNKEKYQLGKELHFDDELTEIITHYLKAKGLIEYHGIGAVIKITESGREYLRIMQ